MSRLIVVSNRVSTAARGSTRTGAGGLEVALCEVLKKNSGIWFGWSGRIVEKGKVATRTIKTTDHTNILTDLTDEDYREYYNGFANRVLWPILHYRLDFAEYSRRDVSGYVRVNEHFANELHKIIKPGDVIWVHDYHLIPLARELRKRGHKNKIGFFLHIPLPPPEVLTALPNHDYLFPSLTEYDLIGFQTETDSLNFARYLIHECKLPSRDLRVFSANDRTTRIGTFPVGVQTEELRGWAEKATQTSLGRRMQGSLEGRLMIIGVDRLDYSKGIVQRMEAYERFLVTQPEWRNKVAYLQITPKSRSKIREYREMEQTVSMTVGRVNGSYGEAEWTPIRYVNHSYTRSALAGFYRFARVGLVTPLRDGMNLVAKEYVACQDPDDPGMLILSRFAGAAKECEAALLINPYDSEAVSRAIGRALTMSVEERRERYNAIMQVLSANDIKFWGEKFLSSLTMTYNEMTMFANIAVPAPRRQSRKKSA